MSRILLADDSPHAQRMGERILREEGYEVVTVTDGDTALIRLGDADPDVIIADAFLPGKSGLDICRYVRGAARHRHTRVILTAGLLEPLDEAEARSSGCDAILRKPFEASAVLELVKNMIQTVEVAKGVIAEMKPEPPPPPEIDGEKVRAAVTLALDAAMPGMIEEITRRVLAALKS